MPTAEDKQIIQKARDRIADPAHWCKDKLAKKANGEPCAIDNPQAAPFCALGAIAVEYLPLYGGNSFLAIGRADSLRFHVWPSHQLTEVNDEEGHAAVLKLFDKALAA
jgi:hypothetical protein